MLRFKNLLTELINNNIFNFMEKKLEKMILLENK